MQKMGQLGPPYFMEYNGNDQSQKLECPLFYILKYITGISCAVKHPSKYSNGFQPFLGMEAYGKMTAHDFNVLRSLCSHSCRGELHITADCSIYVTSVNCLDSSFFYS